MKSRLRTLLEVAACFAILPFVGIGILCGWILGPFIHGLGAGLNDYIKFFKAITK